MILRAFVPSMYGTESSRSPLKGPWEMSVVELALKRPYTVVVVLILTSLMGVGAALRMPIDIFPEIDIPVVAGRWSPNRRSAQDIPKPTITPPQRQPPPPADRISPRHAHR